MSKHEIIRKSFDAYIVEAKQIDDHLGEVEAIVNTFGIIDKAIPPDIVHPGAFTKTIQESFGRIKVLDNHRLESATDTIGKPIAIREVGRTELPDELLAKNPEATGGLYTKTQFMLDDPKSAAIFRRLQAGVLNEFSIGFEVTKSDWSKEPDPETGKDISVRNVREVRLWEYSVVIFGASETAPLAVRNEDLPESTEDKEITPDGELEVQRFGDMLWGMIYGKAIGFTTEMLVWGTLSMEEMEAVTQAMDTVREVLKTSLPDDLWMRPISAVGTLQLAYYLNSDSKHATLVNEDQQQAPEDPPASEAEPPSEALTSTRDQDDQLMRLRLLKLQSQSMEGRDAFTETRPPGGNSAT